MPVSRWAFVIMLLTVSASLSQPAVWDVKGVAISGMQEFLTSLEGDEAIVESKLAQLKVLPRHEEETGSTEFGIREDYVANWLYSVAPGGAHDTPLFAYTSDTLKGWIETLEAQGEVKGNPFSGGVNLPIPQISGAESEWSDIVSKLILVLTGIPSLHQQCLKAETDEVRTRLKSKEWYRARVHELTPCEKLIENLSLAQSYLQTTVPMPRPLFSSERSKSPFNGPPNPGSADRLWIWATRSSAVIGDSIQVDIGLGNERGPNCKADREYPTYLSCDGCTVSRPEVNIPKGGTSVHANIHVMTERPSLRIRSAKLKSAQIRLKGCGVAKTVHLVALLTNATAPADGETQLPFGFVFQNDSGQPATNLLPKQVVPVLTGVGRMVPSTASGAILKQYGIQVPSDECASEQAIISDVVGQTKLILQYSQTQPAAPLEFTFTYSWPLRDVIMIFIGVLLGFLDNLFIPGHRFLRSLFESIIGAIIAVAFGYLFLLSKYPIEHTALLAGAIALVGGTVGVRMAKAAPGWFKGG